MDQIPDKLLINIFSYIDWNQRLRLESVSKKWNRILNGSSLRNIGNVILDSWVVNDQPTLQEAIQSLLVKKRKIISSITMGTRTKVDTMMTFLSAFSTTRPTMLTRLQVSVGSDLLLSNTFSSLLDSFFNLEVLDVSLCTDSLLKHHCPTIRLSGLVNLKELKGWKVHFHNCRAPDLVKLEYECVTLNSSKDKTDFVQMLLTSARNMQILVMRRVKLPQCPNTSYQVVNCKFPRLVELELRHSKVTGVTINLVNSGNLKLLRLTDSTCPIANLDLSVHRLVDFKVVGSNVNNLVDQFVNSAMSHPERLRLLEYLQIEGIRTRKLTGLLGCISSRYSYMYALRKLVLVPLTNGDVMDDVSALIILIKRSPNLENICFNQPRFLIDKKCLIDLIVATTRVNINGSQLLIKFHSIVGGSQYDFITELYNALSLFDTVNIENRNRVLVRYNRETKWSAHLSSLTKRIKDKFNIVICPSQRLQFPDSSDSSD